MIIDGHRHYWSLANPFTTWPPPDLPLIHRDFLPCDAMAESVAAGVAGSVLVQAAPSVAETQWLLDLAHSERSVRGVVGWIDMAALDSVARITAFARQPLLRGLRPMLQDMVQPGWILSSEVEPALLALAHFGLRFDALVRADQIGEVAALARRHPDLGIVLDHAGKPGIAARAFSVWADDLADLAACPNVWCKLSGLWTEAGDDRSDETVGPYVAHVIEVFGPERTIWGSDWPVLRLAGKLDQWLEQCRRLLSGLDKAACDQVFGLNAVEFYGLVER